MSITVIFSDFGDTDTQVLVNLWKDIPDVRLVHITRRTRDAKNKVCQAIAAEKDALLLCGHGLPSGLLSPSADPYSSDGGMLLDKSNVQCIQARRVIGVWCYAAQFAESVGLKGFFTSMFISNIMEAFMQWCVPVEPEVITQQEVLFCNRVNELIVRDEPMEQWVPKLREQADMSIGVVRFNYDGLRYF